jgi:hypothetical protein
MNLGNIYCVSIGGILGFGGFSLFWFVIKKKSLTDLIKIFKEEKSNYNKLSGGQSAHRFLMLFHMLVFQKNISGSILSRFDEDYNSF